MTYQPAVMTCHPKRYAEPYRRTILKLVSVCYHLQYRLFYYPHGCSTQITRTAVVL
jgi:hypothetical protein